MLSKACAVHGPSAAATAAVAPRCADSPTWRPKGALTVASAQFHTTDVYRSDCADAPPPLHARLSSAAAVAALSLCLVAGDAIGELAAPAPASAEAQLSQRAVEEYMELESGAKAPNLKDFQAFREVCATARTLHAAVQGLHVVHGCAGVPGAVACTWM